MTRVDVVWAGGRATLGTITRAVVPVRSYGPERVPRVGGVVLAFNHFHWIDVPVFGAFSPRNIDYVAKVEAVEFPALGLILRAFGTIAIRRGESDREGVRRMRDVVRAGRALGVFVEGTRQRSGVPGRAQPGASMVAIQERVPVVPAAIHGSQTWRPGNWAPVSISWGVPLRLDDLPRNGKGYREGAARIEAAIRRQWEWLVEVHALDRRPSHAIPPA